MSLSCRHHAPFPPQFGLHVTSSTLVAFFLNQIGHVRRDECGHPSEPQHPCRALVPRRAPRTLGRFEDGAADQAGEDLRRGDGHVVETEHDPRLVFRLARRPAAAALHAAGLRVPLGDLGADERKGGPEREGPGKPDHANKRGRGADGGNEKGGKHAECKAEV